MTDLRKAAEMALDALHNIDQSNNGDAIEALRQALAQPDEVLAERDECAKVCDLIAKEIDDTNGIATYCAAAIRAKGEMTKPCETGAQCLGGKCPECVPTYEFECPRCGHCCQQREWVELTEDEVSEIIDKEIGFNSCWGPEYSFARAIEAKLREKNT